MATGDYYISTAEASTRLNLYQEQTDGSMTLLRQYTNDFNTDTQAISGVAAPRLVTDGEMTYYTRTGTEIYEFTIELFNADGSLKTEAEGQTDPVINWRTVSENGFNDIIWNPQDTSYAIAYANDGLVITDHSEAGNTVNPEFDDGTTENLYWIDPDGVADPYKIKWDTGTSFEAKTTTFDTASFYQDPTQVDLAGSAGDVDNGIYDMQFYDGHLYFNIHSEGVSQGSHLFRVDYQLNANGEIELVSGTMENLGPLVAPDGNVRDQYTFAIEDDGTLIIRDSRSSSGINPSFNPSVDPIFYTYDNISNVTSLAAETPNQIFVTANESGGQETLDGWRGYEGTDVLNYTAPAIPPAICFTTGMKIETARGEVAVEDLVVGDMLRTYNNGYQPLRFVYRRKMPSIGMNRPVVFEPNTIGNSERFIVSQQHRIFMGETAENFSFSQFAHPNVYVKAVLLVNGSTIRITNEFDEVEYFHLMLNNHELLYSHGVVSESWQPHLKNLRRDQELREELLRFFPEFETLTAENRKPVCREVMPGHDINVYRQLVETVNERSTAPN